MPNRGALVDAIRVDFALMGVAPGTRLGHYEIRGILGAGGMGTVYRAIDTSLGREVAIKVLPDAFASDPDRQARFEREARTLAALNIPASRPCTEPWRRLAMPGTTLARS